ncbi:MAG: phage holin family protein [Desulfovibrionaceae bacterium]|nr:phage holin family protein [Desulfovibrionaceae bacterium]
MMRIFGDYHELGIMPEIKGALALASIWLLDMTGYPESAAIWLFYLMLADLALGFIRAWKSRAIIGRRILRGAFKFFRYWMAVAVFVWVDAAIFKALPSLPISLRDAFIAYLAINEAFSCVDHLAFFGMPVPDAFLKRLHHYRDTVTAGPGEWNGEERRNGNENHAASRSPDADHPRPGDNG